MFTVLANDAEVWRMADGDSYWAKQDPLLCVIPCDGRDGDNWQELTFFGLEGVRWKPVFQAMPYW